MRKRWKAGIAVALCAGMAAGCGTSVESDTSLVYVNKKGAVTSVDVESLDENSYDTAELQEFVDTAAEDYNAEYGRNSVKVEELTVGEGTAKLRISYKTAEDYAAFNEIHFYQGTVIDSLAAGYTYDTDFVKVEDGQVTGTATKQEIYAEDGLKVVIIRANTDVRVEGQICYVSTENVRLNGPDSVSIRRGYAPEAAEVAETGDAGTDTAAGAQETGSFETQVDTFIVYK